MTTYLYGVFDCCLYDATYAFQSESALYSCLNIKVTATAFESTATQFDSKKYKLLIKESLLIKRDMPVLNRTKSYPLDLFN